VFRFRKRHVRFCETFETPETDETPETGETLDLTRVKWIQGSRFDYRSDINYVK
jgi:hypothetical protein